VAVPVAFALRQRAGTLQDRVEDLQVQVVQLEEEGARLSARAEAAEARASQAEGELAGERIRAHTLSSHMEGYRADLEQARAAAEVAQGEAATLAKTVNELAEAEAARAGQGRWARLRAAWRGE
jgi:chromosome segregation ATPase